jgi:hypothetical protein
MNLKAMVIVYKDIIPALRAKAIVTLAHYCVSEASYCVSQTSKSVNKIT